MQTVRHSRSNQVDWALALDRPKLDEPVVHVDSIMTRNVHTCRAGDPLSVAVQIMWDQDCGAVPVVDDAGHLVGMITDRDVCMAAWLRGKALSEIAVCSACSQSVHTCHSDEPVSKAARIMAAAQVRRLPVVDAEGQLIGIVALSDLARNLCSMQSQLGFAEASEHIVSLLEAVSRPRLKTVDNLSQLSADERECLALFDTP